MDNVSGPEAEPRQVPVPGRRRRDVALAAGVSVATVSNVIHYPDLVAAGTQKRVQRVIQELAFQPGPSPRALRRPGRAFLIRSEKLCRILSRAPRRARWTAPTM
ncbi:LacI family DNA-binding transcriptional regulator [Arthrobacter sp. B2a2-09]|uniref:LacI family DNA-binding transcriptional regulator n=1 Tax=Arthrobacter sp. B2a2-09 TaxID=2952822 RepID=UPI0022CD49E1|nr:LacI family DNA-binding transcriptional regulator [Arthrobacter sp. B2a2-09]MCZ9882819.1 LacI family DNA-binding transcriptional regulator [Arthrobacter sp. B2a2-09]